MEKTPQFVLQLNWKDQESPQITLTNGKTETLDLETLRLEDTLLTCRSNAGEEIKFLRRPYLQLLERVEEDDNGPYLLFEGEKFRKFVHN